MSTLRLPRLVSLPTEPSCRVRSRSPFIAVLGLLLGAVLLGCGSEKSPSGQGQASTAGEGGAAGQASMAGAPDSGASSDPAGPAGAAGTGSAAGGAGMAGARDGGEGGRATAQEPGGAGPLAGRPGGSAGDSGGPTPSAGQGGHAGDGGGSTPTAGQGGLAGDGGSSTPTAGQGEHAGDGGGTGADSAASAGQGGTAEASSASIRSEEKLRVVRGQSAVLTVVVTRGTGQEGELEVTLGTTLGGVGATPAVIAAGETAAQLTVQTVASAVVGGPYPFTVTATLAGSSTPLASFSGSLYVAGEPGTLDTSFGAAASGRVDAVLPEDSTPEVYDLAVDAQGRTLVAGSTTPSGGATTGWVLRLLPSGEVDPSFGVAGFSTGFGTPESEATGLAVKGDQVFVAARVFGDPSTSYVRKLDSVGLPDSTFGTGGDVVLSNSSSAVRELIAYSKGLIAIVPNDSLPWLDVQGTQVRSTGLTNGGSAMAMDAQERVLVGYAKDLDFILFRLLPTGHSDEGFGSEGTVTFSCLSDSPYSIKFDAVLPAPDGATLALAGCKDADYCESDGCFLADVALHAFDRDGLPLDGYGSNGQAVVVDRGLADSAIMQPDNKPLVAYRDVEYRSHLVRFNPNGSVDVGFGAEGIVELLELRDVVALAYEPEGRRVFVLGHTTTGQPAVARHWL